MSQTFNDAVPAITRDALSDLTAMRGNFAALKSCFSGPTAPPNPVAGMWWYDTTANMLKLRNEANSAWLDVYDFANQRVPLALLASNCSRTVVGGTAVTVTGSLNGGNATVSITPGAVGATQLAADGVNMSKMQHGSIMLPFFPTATITINETSWKRITPIYRVYIPVNATSLQMSIHVAGGVGTRYYRYKVGSLTSSTGSQTGTSAAWGTLNLDVSSRSGWQTMYIEAYYSGTLGATDSFAFAWM